MKNILVDEDLHSELKSEAAEKKISLTDYCEGILKKRIIKEGIELPNKNN